MERHKPEGHKYLVYYKHPRDRLYRIWESVVECRIKSYEGICENFTPSGSCVFSSDEGMLVVGFEDIIQMIPIGVDK